MVEGGKLQAEGPEGINRENQKTGKPESGEQRVERLRAESKASKSVIPNECEESAFSLPPCDMPRERLVRLSHQVCTVKSSRSVAV